MMLNNMLTSFAKTAGFSLCVILFSDTLPLFLSSLPTLRVPAEGLIVPVILLPAAFIAGAVSMRKKTQSRVAAHCGHYTRLLCAVNQKLLLAEGKPAIADLTNECLVAFLHRTVAFFFENPELRTGPSVLVHSPAGGGSAEFDFPSERALVSRFFYGEVSEPQLSERGIFYIPVHSERNILAVIGILCSGGRLTEDEFIFTRLLLLQTALALELECARESARALIADAEHEKTRGTLLRAVSHDLRTPLAGILGAGTAILEQKGLSENHVTALASDIRDNAQWLIRLVENILAATRVSDSGIQTEKTPEAAEEVLSQAISIIRRQYPNVRISVHIPEELLIVPMDATLVCQALINLLENAVENAGENAQVEARLGKQNGFALFEISDSGPGISEHALEVLFSSGGPLEPGPANSRKNRRLGLSICKTIVTAHGGKITGSNRKKGGAKFTLLLPLQGGGNG